MEKSKLNFKSLRFRKVEYQSCYLALLAVLGLVVITEMWHIVCFFYQIEGRFCFLMIISKHFNIKHQLVIKQEISCTFENLEFLWRMKKHFDDHLMITFFPSCSVRAECRLMLYQQQCQQVSFPPWFFFALAFLFLNSLTLVMIKDNFALVTFSELPFS